MNFQEYLEALVDLYHREPERQKLAIIATGGGVSVADLLKIPGSSAAVSAIYLPYDNETTDDFISDHTGKGCVTFRKGPAVSKEAAELLLGGLAGAVGWTAKGNVFVAITAALTTNRYRRGQNHAFVAVGNRTTVVSSETINLPKRITEEQFLRTTTVAQAEVKKLTKQFRTIEDEQVARFALELATGFKG